MRFLVTGAQGQVGRALAAAAWPEGAQVAVHGRDRLDITDPQAVAAALDEARPDVVVNAAAYTAVDQAEAEPETAFAANRDGPAQLARACRDRGAALLHLSTDYVFDGTKDAPWREDDPVRPLGVYGHSKAEGEAAVRAALDRHVILRTAWVHSAGGHNFVRTMLRVGAQRDRLQVVDDQVGCPTAAADIAAALIAIADRIARGDGRFGTYHFCGDEAVSWHGFATAIFDLAAAHWGRRPEVARITSDQWPTPAQRPANSVLDCAALARDYGIPAADWRSSLRTIVAALLAGDDRTAAQRSEGGETA
jgi:dTDP-4-dehydrorhamnose reductase